MNTNLNSAMPKGPSKAYIPITIWLFIMTTMQLSFAQNYLEKPIWQNMFKLYATANPGQSLFIHFDKTVYATTDSIRFAMYLLESSPARLTSQNVLVVALINYKNGSVYTEDKFLIENGIANGRIGIPDTVPSGNYYLLAYTNLVNRQGRPVNCFYQPVSLKGVSSPAIKDISVAQYPSDKSSNASKTDKVHINIKLYPEGGHLSGQLLNLLGWEAKDESGRLVQVKCNLMEDGKEIGVVETGTFGIGRFRLVPKIASKYTLKLLSPGYADTNTIYPLPDVQPNWPILTVSKAAADDTLKLLVRTSIPQKMQLLIHNYRTVFANITISATPNGSTVKFDLHALPKGLATATLLDSLGRPLAERMFFAHVNQGDKIELSTNKAIYKPKEPVTVSLSLTGLSKDIPLQIQFSIACVQEGSLGKNQEQYISNYAFLTNELQDLQIVNADLNMQNSAMMEDILLVKGWRRYNWANMITVDTKDTVGLLISPSITGSISNFNKPVKRAVKLSVISDGNIQIMTTSNQGRFILDPGAMASIDNKKVTLKVVGSDLQNRFQIALNDEFKVITLKEARNYRPDLVATTNSQETSEQPLSLLNRIQTLKEIKISGQKKTVDFVRFPNDGEGKNACGDYICAYGGINCHYEGHWKKIYKPIKGKVYIKHADTRKADAPGLIAYNTPTEYKGCENEEKTSNYLVINGIQVSKQLYEYRAADLNSNTTVRPTTLYWNPVLNTDKDGKVEFSFPASNYLGNFQIILQGISTNDLLYKKISFDVVGIK